jgi:hypothetical protein
MDAGADHAGSAPGITITCTVSLHPPAAVYVITLVPEAAEEGVNVPAEVLVIPVPLHTPPATLVVRLKAAALEQTGATGLITGCGLTVTVPVAVPVQPESVYDTV